MFCVKESRSGAEGNGASTNFPGGCTGGSKTLDIGIGTVCCDASHVTELSYIMTSLLTIKDKREREREQTIHK